MKIDKDDIEYFDVKGNDVSILTILVSVIIVIACYAVPLLAR